MRDMRDKALEMVEEGLITADDMLMMCLKYMSVDEVEDMLDCNEIHHFVRYLEQITKP